MAFAIQIYCDFSGYSDIAIGSAEVLGFKLMTNFNRPYSARSVREFWTRWHISLSTWFRDYVYIPLGGNRCSQPRWRFNILVTFLLSGFWHGADWTYVLWGAINGIYLIVGTATQKFRDTLSTAGGLKNSPRLHQLIQTGITFTLICVAWIFFRASTITEAWYIVRHLFSGARHGAFSTLFAPADWGILLFGLIVLTTVQLLQQRMGSARLYLNAHAWWIRWPAYYALVFCTFFSWPAFPEQFIYFQF